MTYGIAIYQEQYMEIAKQLAGFTPAEADDLRKAIGKKIHKLMASLKDKFLEGCAQNGVAAGVAQQLWKDTEASQDYSFNKSHAACYALIAYRTAYMRAHHPREYMASLISSVMSTKDRVPFYVNACDEMGIEVLPPDVNESQLDFAVVEGKIRFGLSAVKNVGRAGGARDHSRARGGRAVHVDLGVLRAGRSAGLEQAGARVAGEVRGAGLDRRDAAGDAGGARVGARRAARARSRTGCSARARSSARRRSSRTCRSPARSSRRASCCGWRRKCSGLYVSEHPLHSIRDQLRRKTDCALADVERRRDGEIVTVGGIVSALKHLTTKKGEPMVFMRLDDVTGGAEVVVFNSVYAHVARAVRDGPDPRRQGPDRPQAGGRDEAARDGGGAVRGGRRAQRGDDQDRRARRAAPASCATWPLLVKDFPGDSRVNLLLEMSEGTKQFVLGPQYKVKPVPDFFAEAKALLGEAAVL